MKNPTLPPAVLRTLRRVFGLRRLRPGQDRVISRVLAGQDTLAVMPTGAGKSLCYQLPSLHLKGTTVVVSPLIALMKDQAERLEDAGISAEQMHSAQPRRDQQAAMSRIADERSDVVLATPERLADAGFLATLQRQRISLVVVDEAHCISRWGHDFRPAFLEIGAALHALGNPPVLGLTATATEDVIEDIRRQLGRPAMPPPAPAEQEPPPVPSAAPAFEAGTDVEVPRYGSGRVVSSSAHEVMVVFPNGRKRSFMATYVRPASGRGPG